MKELSSAESRVVLLDPEQLVSMNDYPPLHSHEALRKYYSLYVKNQRDQIMPLPVIPVSIVLSYFVMQPERFAHYEPQLQQFLLAHPKAGYFKIDGTHRASAGMLTCNTIRCFIIESENDLQELRRLGIGGLGENLVDTLDEQEQHYFQHKHFWTLQEKVKYMIENGDIPNEFLKVISIK